MQNGGLYCQRCRRQVIDFLRNQQSQDAKLNNNTDRSDCGESSETAEPIHAIVSSR
jgi:hypothetical protein